MRKILALTAVSAAALLASPASAQAVSGPRIELLAGWDNIKTHFPDVTIADNHISEEGLVYGIGAGYDFAVGPGFAVGVDLEATRTDVDLAETEEVFFENGPDTTTPPFNDDTLLRTRFEADPSLDLYAGVRATFAASDSLLFYLKGGYTRLRVRERVFEDEFPAASPDVPSTQIFSDRRNLSGWRAGVGAQFTNGRFYAGPEYRYSRYEDHVRRHQIVGVIGMRFGPRAEPLPPPPPVEAPPPPPPPVATQTCPDGTVIPATDVCPAPPPPPPPPPAPERG